MTTDLAVATSCGGLNDIDIMVVIVNFMEPVAGTNQRSTYNTWLSGNANNCGAGANQACGTRMLWGYDDCFSTGGCDNGTFLNVPQAYPNKHIDGKPAANRAMEWVSYINNLSGELYFESGVCNLGACGIPATSHAVWTTNFNQGGWGDGTLVYPGSINAGSAGYMGAGVTTPIFVPSMRLKDMRDGEQDYEILNKLNAVGQGAFVTSTLANWLTNTYTFETSGAGLMNARVALLAKMQALTSPPAAPTKLGILSADKPLHPWQPCRNWRGKGACPWGPAGSRIKGMESFVN